MAAQRLSGHNEHQRKDRIPWSGRHLEMAETLLLFKEIANSLAVVTGGAAWRRTEGEAGVAGDR